MGPGVRCVAAPIFDESGHVLAAISLSGPTARISAGKISLLGAWVSRATRLITAELGGMVDERLLAEP